MAKKTCGHFEKDAAPASYIVLRCGKAGLDGRFRSKFAAPYAKYFYACCAFDARSHKWIAPLRLPALDLRHARRETCFRESLPFNAPRAAPLCHPVVIASCRAHVIGTATQTLIFATIDDETLHRISVCRLHAPRRPSSIGHGRSWMGHEPARRALAHLSDWLVF